MTTVPNSHAIPLSVIVLTGGRGKRMGGACKPTLHVRGKRIIDHLLQDLTTHTPQLNLHLVVLVGPDLPDIPDALYTSQAIAPNATEISTIETIQSPARKLSIPVITTREHPIYGGPVAGITAGYQAIQTYAAANEPALSHDASASAEHHPGLIAVIPGDSPTAGEALVHLIAHWYHPEDASQDQASPMLDNQREKNSTNERSNAQWSEASDPDTTDMEGTRYDSNASSALCKNEPSLVVGVTPDGHKQWLHFVTTTTGLATCIAAGDPQDQSVRRFVQALPQYDAPLPMTLAKDYDTPADY